MSATLIAPTERDTVSARPGDSGMIWHLAIRKADTPVGDLAAPLDPGTPLDALELRPLALEWGGQTFRRGETT